MIFKIYARIPIYQVQRHPWKRSGIPEQAVFKIVKKVHFVILSFFLFARANSRLSGPLTLV